MESSAKSLVLKDLEEKYEAEPVSPKFERLYKDETLAHMRAVLHEKLNEHFLAINDRSETTHHYWAEPSRDLISLRKNLRQDLHNLRRVGITFKLIEVYEDALERCTPWLSPSGGSTVPDNFQQINIIEYEQAIIEDSATQSSIMNLNERQINIERQLIGEGSYAHVYRYLDPNYGKNFAIKRAKRSIEERELTRFKKEFEIMQRLDFPYVLEVYSYDDSSNEYSMEYCDETLRHFINKRNANLNMTTRKRIALQFLYGINYLHLKGVYHRDISYQNILVKLFDMDTVIVKLSDFGLAKERSSAFTRTDTEIRGTIVDPHLDAFKDYGIVNEVYAIGCILSFIFTGRYSLQNKLPEIGPIISKCTAPDTSERYASVLQIIQEIEKLPF